MSIGLCARIHVRKFQVQSRVLMPTWFWLKRTSDCWWSMSTHPPVNAMSTRVRHFGSVCDGKSGSMSERAGKMNARNQRLGPQDVEITKQLESHGIWLIT